MSAANLCYDCEIETRALDEYSELMYPRSDSAWQIFRFLIFSAPFGLAFYLPVQMIRPTDADSYVTGVTAALIGVLLVWLYSQPAQSKGGSIAPNITIGPSRMILTDDRLRFETTVAIEEIFLSAIRAVQSHRHILMIHIASATPHFVPRNCFATQADEDHFIKVLRSRIGRPKGATLTP